MNDRKYKALKREKRKRKKLFEFLSRCHGKDQEAARWLMNLEHKAKNNRKLQKELESIC